MKNTLLLGLLLVTFPSFSQKDTLKNKITYSVGFQANIMSESNLGSQKSEHYLIDRFMEKGGVVGVGFGAIWRNWKVAYRGSFAFTTIYNSYAFRNSNGMFDFYTIKFHQKSVINSLELSRLLLIPESKYSFEVGVGLGFNYSLPEELTVEKSFFYEEFPNEYDISNSVINNNPNHITTHFKNVFLRFYRQFGKHSVGLNMDLINIVNPFVVDLYTDKKYAFSISETSSSYTKKYSQFSFGINYKLTLGK